MDLMSQLYEAYTTIWNEALEAICSKAILALNAIVLSFMLLCV